jgi:RNA recognition motif-containing protein
MFRDGRFRGTCFVEFAEDSSVHKANMMDGSIIQEKHLTIRRARAQTKESTQKSSGKASRVKEESIQPKSNADFRKMLQSKKRKKSYYSSTGK